MSMRPQELKEARLRKGWVQTDVAARLGVSQAYVNMLERGKRRLTPRLTRKLVTTYGFSPEVLSVPESFKPVKVEAEYLAESLGRLGYPGFAYVHSHVAKKNPGEVLLTALAQDSLEARLAEALPWLPLQYWRKGSTCWLVEQSRKLNLQNRLGFVVSLARQVSERDPQNEDRTRALRDLEKSLDESRLVKEDVFYRKPRTEGEKEWLLQNRSAEAVHWNLLTDLKPEHLQYAG